MESNCDDYFGKGRDEFSVELLNADLWTKFHSHGTEMIVTKNGRRMFPFMRLKITGLDPTALYCILLEFNSASNHRFKYYANTGWTPAGSEEPHSNQRVYMHPDSPATGEHWMAQSTSFGRVKLTNTTMPSTPGLIVLSSMHKYQPRIVIVKSIDPRAKSWAPTTTVTFPETQFLAVTAYQNEEITKLKIEHNPFAKGFRETGQGKCKRKRLDSESSDKKESKKIFLNSPASSVSPSPESVDNSIETSPMPFHNPYPSYMPYPFLQFPYPYYFYYNQNWSPYYKPYTLPQTPHLNLERITKNQRFKTLHQTESMVSLCYRSLAGYVNEDNLQGLQSFLENKQVQVDDKDENGTTALILAASKGKLAFVKELLSHGSDPNSEDNDSWSALLCAAKDGYTDICHELLEHGAEIDHRDMGGWTAIMWATYKGRTDVVTLLIGRGADVNAHGNYHISSLLWAAGRGYTQIAQALISHGAKVNFGDKYGTTALVWACRKGYSDIVSCLLRAGANVDTAGMYSWTALLVATQGNHVDVVNLLLEYKPNVNALDKDGCSALTIACKEGYYEIATALMSAGAYINVQDRAGDTNLIHAVKGGHRGVVEALLKKYADVDITGKDRKTALYMAVEKGNASIVKLLLNANPDLEVATKDGDTPLLKAVRSRSAEIVQLLLDKKAKVAAADKKGDTALHIAMRARSKAIVEILLRNPKHSQLLYRPNRAGETPYNIDINHQKTILGQIFGARRLNTNEDNENMLGYDLYSSALADILSEPSLSMPITVGLYAKWGSGKSFLLGKLRDEMKNFAREWVDPIFQFTSLLFIAILHIAIIIGVIGGLAIQNWIFGISLAVGVLAIVYIFLGLIWFAGKRYDWDWPYNFNLKLTRKMNSLKLILQVMFCHPPGTTGTDVLSAQPIRFYFTDQTRVSSTIAGENCVVQMIGSLYDAIEKDYGSLATRLYRAFKPKPVKSSSWKLRKLCCVPSAALFEGTFICLLLGICALTIFLLDLNAISVKPTEVERLSLHIIMITSALVLGIATIANLYTWNRMFSSVIFSQRRQLQRSIAKLDTLKSEGFLQTLRKEVNLMKDMVKCLDSLTSQQTRLVIVVDGLDSCEQDKVLLVLDAVHLLFSDANSPFIIILAIDPHVIAKAVEINSRRLFSESNIGGHSYLSNMVHLPFYLQNSGLRKVKLAQQTSQNHRKLTVASWNEVDDNVNLAGNSLLGRSLSSRRLSTESTLMSSTEKLKFARKNSRKLKLSDSVASSIGSNLNKIGGAQDLTKMLLTDDYFSDVNPRSMRRLMNVVYVTGRLLKAFQIDFNWYRLASWINITEQWPFRTSWIIYHFDTFEDSLDDSTPLKSLYEKVRPFIPSLKDIEPLLELDRDERKFDIFLTFHRSSLLVSDLKIFLPFTINLDPYLKKVIKEETQGMDDEGIIMTPARSSHPPPNYVQSANTSWSTTDWTPSTKRGRNFGKHNIPAPPTMMYPATSTIVNWQHPWDTSLNSHYHPVGPVTELSPEVLENKLSQLSVDGICKLLNKIEDLDSKSLTKYKEVIKDNNINGKVLLHCDLIELKKLLQMSFGDWEMFRVLIVSLREYEMTRVTKHDETKNVRMAVNKPPMPMPSRERKASAPKITSGLSEKELSKLQSDAKGKQSVMEKQVTLEDQMICGALQTLNEEACEDVLEETEDTVKRLDMDIPQTSVIPPSPDGVQDAKSNRSRSQSTAGIEETDYVILQSSPIGYLHWQPISLSVHGNTESLSDHSSHGSSQPSSPVSERQRKYGRADSIEIQRRGTKHVVIKTENSTSLENKKPKPTSLYLLREAKSKPPYRNRSKSIEIDARRAIQSKTTLHKIKEKLLQSNPDLNDETDTESTPLVSQVATPLTSPGYTSSSTPDSAPPSESNIQVAIRYCSQFKKNLSGLYEFSPTKEGAVSDSSLNDNDPRTSWYTESLGRSRTMSECADSLAAYTFEPGARSLTISNISLFKSSQSLNGLHRQDALDSEENIADVYCDPETRV
ncbi:hypothetical protein RN001_011578 [Aquatica leii]|uniref:T-box domain-containing protein n=1 Tax=Aquatica leii TaxID=1421715 RepID=A0AAN7P4G6_9COLE|nr:hypothetical protein RN001_011578 [Aquatica leii]